MPLPIQCDTVINAVLSDTRGTIANVDYPTVEGAIIREFSNTSIKIRSEWQEGMQQIFRYIAIAV